MSKQSLLAAFSAGKTLTGAAFEQLINELYPTGAGIETITLDPSDLPESLAALFEDDGTNNASGLYIIRYNEDDLITLPTGVGDLDTRKVNFQNSGVLINVVITPGESESYELTSLDILIDSCTLPKLEATAFMESAGYASTLVEAMTYQSDPKPAGMYYLYCDQQAATTYAIDANRNITLNKSGVIMYFDGTNLYPQVSLIEGTVQ